MLPTNQILNQGRYRVINQIGQDETGIVYEAFDETVRTNVLLKEILFGSKKVIPAAELDKLRTAFSEKSKKLIELRHQSLLQVHGYFSEIDRYYLVLEYAEGNNLNKLLEKDKCSFALSNVMNWSDQLLFALSFLHTQPVQVFHGNVNPQNLRLTSNGEIKLFPAAISADSETKIGSAASDQAIESAALNYLPLEQIWDKLDAASQTVIAKSYDEKSEKILRQPIDARSDIFSLSATIYHLATGQPPVDALTRSIDILEGKPDPLPPLCEINRSIPREVSDVLMKALEIKRENRFDSAVIIRQILRTSALRAKERQATEAKKQVIETPPPVAAVVEAKPSAVENKPKSFVVRSEKPAMSEIEAMKKRLREAEEERLKAEQRAAEAEKLLLAQKTAKAAEPEMPAAPVGFTQEKLEIVNEPLKIVETHEEFPDIIDDAEEEFPEILSAEVISTAPTFETATPTFSTSKIEFEAPFVTTEKPVVEVSTGEFNTLFVEQPKESKVMVKVAAAGLVLALIGGAVWGVLNFSNAPNQTISTTDTTQTMQAQPPAPIVSDEKPLEETTPAPMPAPTVESAKQTDSETQIQSGETADSVKTNPTVVNQPAVKPKQVVTTTAPEKPKKPAIASAKPPETKKKAVTVEDLINGN